MFTDLVSNIDLVVILKTSGSLKNNIVLYNVIKSRLYTELNQESDRLLKAFCAKYCYNLQRRWKSAHSKEDVFRTNNNEWLASEIDWPDFIKNILNSTANTSAASTSTEFVSPEKVSIATSTMVSPRKPFSELGPKQKKRRTEHIHTTMTSEEISHAHITKLREDRNGDIADILDHLLKNPQDVQKVKNSILDNNEKPKFTADEALGLVLSLKLSKWQYNIMRRSVNEKNADLFPSYYKVQMAKQECYPPKSDITVTDTEAKIQLQSLLDVTTKRILKTIDSNESKELTLISKCGFDGASNQANYKQRMPASNTERNDDDSSIFMGSLVPIKIVSGDQLVWENDSPNSAFSCRPVFFKFQKEDKTTLLNAKNEIEAEINNLKETEIEEIKVSHSVLLTMIDGKATSVLCDSSTQRCDICKATPTEMNNLPLVLAKKVDNELFKYGISSLHMWIRFMECILHIAYRIEFKTWIAKGENKAAMENRKKEIQDAFKNQTGLLIDKVKQGHGTTNDGNTARRFFANTDITASITGIDKNLITKFATILEAISSGQRIDTVKFKEYTDATMNLYIDLYKWYYMPASIHKVLVHGADIIENFGLIPIGKLSEEAAESRNKDFRRYRENHSRKFSRKASNQDILNNLLITSDPYISTKRHKMIRKHRELSEEAKALLILHNNFEEDDEQENIEFVNLENIDTVSDLEPDDDD